MMKNLLFTLVLFLPLLGFSQINYNELTKAEYYNITFDNVPLDQLSGFQGSMDDLSQLFNATFTNTSNDPEEEAKDYENKDFLISYFGYPPEMDLSAVIVISPSVTVNIKGVNIHIGDNINLLGYSDIDFRSSVYKEDTTICFALFRPEYSDTYITITFNANDGTIEEIEYVSPS